MLSSFAMTLLYLLRCGAFLLSYVSNTHSFPKPLSPREEARYIELACAGDQKAKDILVERNLRLVAHVVKKYSATQNGSCDSDDLISIGTIGLIKAVNSYDGSKNVRLATYAARCIENELLMLMRNQKKLAQEVSLNDCLGHDADGNEVTFMDVLPSDEEEISDTVGLNMDIRNLYQYIQTALDDREKEIVQLRYGLAGEPLTQREIAAQLGISRSYVSRIEKKALQKLWSRFSEDESTEEP